MNATPHEALAFIHAERGDHHAASRELDFILKNAGISDEYEGLRKRLEELRVATTSERSFHCAEHAITSISPSPDGRLIAVGAKPDDQSKSIPEDILSIWNVEDGTCSGRFESDGADLFSMGAQAKLCSVGSW
jgi:hypothetical protein